MKPNDLFFVNQGFMPFYRVPINHVFQVYTRWNESCFEYGKVVSRLKFSNFLKKADEVSGILSSHDGGKMVIVDQRELVLDVTDENYETYHR
jgi:hypothetical protein